MSAPAAPDARWVTLVQRLAQHEDEVIVAFLDAALHDDAFPLDLVPRDDVEGTARDSFGEIVASLPHGVPRPELLELAADFGERRARQGIPPDAVLTAVRLDVAMLWEALRGCCEPSEVEVLVEHTGALITVVDAFITRTNQAYLAEYLRLTRHEMGRRSALLAELFHSQGASAVIVQRVASALDLGVRSDYTVIAACGPAAESLRQIAAANPSVRLLHHQAGDTTWLFWEQIPANRRFGQAVADVGGVLLPDIQGLAQVPAAARTAQTLARTLRPDETTASGLSALWLRAAREALSARGVDIAGPVVAALAPLGQVERDRLLETLAVLAQTGSSTETARRLHLHRNSVVKRVDRIVDLTGLDPRVPVEAAQLVIALL